MLGIALLFVGIVLVHNGIMFMSRVKKTVANEDGTTSEQLIPLVVASPKTVAYFNIIVGAIIVIGNFILLAFHAPYGYANWQNIAAGLVFGVTYLFIAGNLLLKLDMRSFGWYCLGASIFALIMVVYNLVQLGDIGMEYGYSFLILALLWISWFPLWFAGALEFIFNMKIMQRIFPWISIVVGIIGAFLPAIALLTGWWGLLG